jgi:hypothetical protein
LKAAGALVLVGLAVSALMYVPFLRSLNDSARKHREDLLKLFELHHHDTLADVDMLKGIALGRDPATVFHAG